MSVISLGPDHNHPTPPGVKRFGLYSVAWAAWGIAFFVIEVPAIIKNKHGGRDDYQHRTLTENVRWLAATDRDGQSAKLRRFRRIGLLGTVAWGVAHFLTDGDYV
jgi:hypothetical protein